MQATVIKELSASEVNYEEAPLLTLEVESIEYRIDTGYLSAVAISQREPGTSIWVPVTEGRWDGTRLREKRLSHTVNAALAEALRFAMAQREERGEM